MHGLKREVLEDVPDSSRLDVVLLERRQGLLDVARAEAALKLGELDQRQPGVVVPLDGVPAGIEEDIDRVLDRVRRFHRQLLLPELLDLLLHRLLSLPELLHVLPELLELVARLRGARLDGAQRQKHNRRNVLGKTVASCSTSCQLGKRKQETDGCYRWESRPPHGEQSDSVPTFLHANHGTTTDLGLRIREDNGKSVDDVLGARVP